MPIYSNGTPITGSNGDDYIAAYGPVDTIINAGNGNDVVYGDYSDFFLGMDSSALAAAANVITNPSYSALWTRSENPDIVNSTTVTHASVLIDGGLAGQQGWMAITVAAGDIITLDVDYGGNTGLDTDTTLRIFANDGTTQLAYNDDAPLDPGSSSSFDSGLTYTFTLGGTYFVRIGDIGGAAGNFAANDSFILNILLTGQAAGATVADGNDTINGGDGNDVLMGLGGNDIINGGIGIDDMRGGAGIDTLLLAGSGYTGFVNVDLAAGTISSVASIERAEGFENVTGTDTTRDNITGTEVNNILLGLGGADELSGEGGNDSLTGGTGIDILRGGSGFDYFLHTSANENEIGEVYDGGADLDTISIDHQAAGYTLNLRDDFLTSIESFEMGETGSNFAGIVQVNAAQFGTGLSTYLSIIGSFLSDSNDVFEITMGTVNSFDANNLGIYSFDSANDVVRIVGDSDYEIIGGSSVNDDISGGEGEDYIRGSYGNDILHGDDGIDTLSGGAGNDTIYGGADDDTIFGGIAQVDATETGNDFLYGNDGLDSIYGNGGDDLIVGGLGADFLIGGTGNDTLYGGLSAVDTTDLSDDFMRGGDGTDLVYGNNGNDKILGGAGIDTLYGGEGNDTLYGGALLVDATDIRDFVYGGNGNDDIRGNGGDDFLFGEAGDDSVIGGLGDDYIAGGIGNDYLRGGDGADGFIFNTALDAATNMDTIQAFVLNIDDIFLSQTIFSNIGATLDAAEFQLGLAANDASDRIIYNSATGQLFYDANGNVNGSTDQVQFAQMTVATGALPALTINDFIMIA
jgi:Ca2+-binding RTX toxin-like protein